METHSLITFLQTTFIKDIKKTTSLITLRPTDTVKAAFELLCLKEITAVAVYEPHGNHFYGFVDTLDLTVFIIRVFAENFDRHPHLYDPKELEKRFLMPVRDIINASQRDLFQPVEITENLHFLITNFLQHAVHRVPVLEKGQIVGIVSQSDVIKYLSRNCQGNDIMYKTIEQLGLDHGSVISISNDHTLMKAFTKIVTNNISALAVVNMKGKLVNCISASDLKGITLTSFFKLEIPIHEAFLYNPQKLPPVTCGRSTTLGELLKIAERTGVHRVFVVDDENRPTNVITLTNILQIFGQPKECM